MTDYGYCQSEACWGDAYMDGPTVRKVMQGIHDVGGSRVRIGVQVGTWADLDRAINTAIEFDLKPLVCILGNQQLVNGSVTNAVAFGTLCKQIALRYGPSGSNQVSEYELYNESNISINPPQVSTAAAFTEFLKAGYTAIKSVHTSSTVIAGGTIPSPKIDFAAVPILWPPFIVFGSSVNPVDWYAGIYAAGGKGYFDAVGFHWYFEVFPTETDVHWTYLADVRAVMVANGDSAKKIWITEVGAGFPGPGVSSLVQLRDLVKVLVDSILTRDYCGPFYIYNYRNATSNTSDAGGANYGIVTFYDVPRSPYYEYAQSISEIPADLDDIVPPTAPTEFAIVSTTSQTATAVWGPAMDDVGVTVYRIYDDADDSKIAETTQLGQTAIVIGGLTPGTSTIAYVTAVDAAGNESLPSNTFEFTTDAPSGLQSYFQYDFTGTGSTQPTVFASLGLGFSVSAGVALPNASSTDGAFLTVAPYTLDQQSPDHSSSIVQATASANPDRAAFALVRVSPDGSQFAGATITGGGQADACKVFTYSGGVLTIQDARNATPLQPGERLTCTAEGNVYTATRITADGVSTEAMAWTDLNGAYPGAANRRTGIGWSHRRVGGVNYPPPGITGPWKASDLNAVQPDGAGGFDIWMLAITEPQNWGLVISTGLWEAAL